MTKLELEAIRALPEVYVRDGTQVMLVNDRAVAINAELVPMIFIAAKWVPLKLDTSNMGQLRVIVEEMGPPIKPEPVPLMLPRHLDAFEKNMPFYKYCPEQQIEV